MKVFINGTEVNRSWRGGESFAQVLNNLDKEYPQDEVITKACLNGEEFTLKELRALPSNVGAGETLRLRTESIDQVVKHVLEETIETLIMVQRDLKESANYFSENERSEAGRSLLNCRDGLRRITALLSRVLILEEGEKEIRGRQLLLKLDSDLWGIIHSLEAGIEADVFIRWTNRVERDLQHLIIFCRNLQSVKEG